MRKHLGLFFVFFMTMAFYHPIRAESYAEKIVGLVEEIDFIEKKLEYAKQYHKDVYKRYGKILLDKIADTGKAHQVMEEAIMNYNIAKSRGASQKTLDELVKVYNRAREDYEGVRDFENIAQYEIKSALTSLRIARVDAATIPKKMAEIVKLRKLSRMSFLERMRHKISKPTLEIKPLP